MRALLEQLCQANGPTGFEGPAVEVAKHLLTPLVDEVYTDRIGSVVGVLAVPQCAIQFALLFGATMLMPYTTPTMFADFSACGGIIMLGAGLRQMGLVQVPILSMLPGLFFVMPLSALWKQIM